MSEEAGAGAARAEPGNTLLVPIRSDLPWRSVGGWLRRGWQDFRKCWPLSAWFGLCFVCMGWLQLLIFQHAPAYSMAMISGFLLAGPFLCTAVYQLSQTVERGVRPRFLPAALAFRPVLANIGIFAAVLLVLELLWGRASLVVFALFYQGGLPTTADLLAALAKFTNVDFLIAYIVVGAIFATLVFVVSAVAIPMLLDRRTDAITAGLTSVRACLGSPSTMAVWAGTIVLLTLLAMLPGFIGLIVVGPWLGHATWHAYRDLVVAEAKSDAAAETLTTD